MRVLLLSSIRLYQRAISPGLGARCRFEPSCSQYAYEAVDAHGARRGVWLAVKRLTRCRPGVPGGYDPVPGRGERLDTAQGDTAQFDTEQPGTADVISGRTSPGGWIVKS